MDEVFKAGKFKGRRFSDVAAREPSFCTWAKRQRTPTGYVKRFVDFLGTSRKGQCSIDAFARPVSASATTAPPVPLAFGVDGVPTQPRAASGGAVSASASTSTSAAHEAVAGRGRGPSDNTSAGVRLDFTFALEVSAGAEFDVGPADPDAEVPLATRTALAAHPSARPAPLASHWRFPAEAYTKVLQWLQFDSACRCRVEPVPSWVLRRLPAFSEAAVRGEALEQLRLSASTMRVLADLPGLRQAPLAGNVGSRCPGTLAPRQDASAGVGLQPTPEADFEGLGGELLPFQKEGVIEGLRRGGRFLLGDEMGLGKTVTALALARQFRREWPVLVVAPAPLCRAWRDHALTWLPADLGPEQVAIVRSSRDRVPVGTKLVVVPYTLIAEPELQTHPGTQRSYDVVILDECHMLRGSTTQRARTAVSLAQRARRAFLLSGTPLVSRAADAHPLLDAILPRGDVPNLGDFTARYRETSASHASAGTPRGAGSCVKPARLRTVAVRRKGELHLLLGSVMLRRLKADLLPQLPPKRRQRVLLELSARHAATEPAPASRAEHMPQVFEQLSTPKARAVAEYVRCLLAAEAKFLLFAHHLRMLDNLERVLLEESVGYVRIDGGTPMPARARSVETFQNSDDVRVALLSLTACGQGLTLSSASLVVFAELYWVPGALLQAEDRAHRLGQANPVDVHYLVAEGSVDERMFEVVEQRARDTRATLDGGDSGVGLGPPAPPRRAPGMEACPLSASAALAQVGAPATAEPLRAQGSTEATDSDGDSVELVVSSTTRRGFAWGAVARNL